MKRFFPFILTLLLSVNLSGQQKGTFTAGEKTFTLNGKPFVVKAAEVHYPRIPKPYWEHRIKMCKALGMNTLCLYVFWNIHEPVEGEFDFTGQNDVAAFCRLASENGMYVIVRPGPYVCAEWEMGGLPWWLLKKKDIRLRELDPYFMERVKIFERKLGEQLSPLTIQNGGPIIMIQVENEYGSYGEDKPYIAAIRDELRDIYGDEIVMFQCDWASNFEKNALGDLVWTMNFGTGANISEQFERLGQVRPSSPLMCSEFWSGWFDKWGARHETRPAKDMVEGIDEMLSKGISFSLYMTHGGTSFGHWAGANSPGFAPDVTSYDYDAPINEWGQPTEKFHQLRSVMQKYSDGSPLPDIPSSPLPIISVPKFSLTQFSPLEKGIAKSEVGDIRTFEEMDMGWGCMVYTTTLPEITSQSLLRGEFHDFAQVYIDGKYIGKIDRVRNQKALSLPPVRKGAVLKIVVEGMGRINFGRAIKDFKGIIGKVTIDVSSEGISYGIVPSQWTCSTIPDDYGTACKALSSASYTDGIPEGSGYYRGYFTIDMVGDTFLDFESWGKGQVYVNGHPLGRIWSIGPQQTLYTPGCWLKKGQNEIVVLDVIGPREVSVWGQETPELDKLQLEKGNKHDDEKNRPDLEGNSPVASGSLSEGNGWQTISFPSPATGRYLCLECLSTQSGDDVVSIAEIYALDSGGRRLSRESWTARYSDSEQDQPGNHTIDKVFDLQESTYWKTAKGDVLPHLMVIDLGKEQTIYGIEYLPRANKGAPGSVKDYKVYLFD